MSQGHSWGREGSGDTAPGSRVEGVTNWADKIFLKRNLFSAFKKF